MKLRLRKEENYQQQFTCTHNFRRLQVLLPTIQQGNDKFIFRTVLILKTEDSSCETKESKLKVLSKASRDMTLTTIFSSSRDFCVIMGRGIIV